MFPQLLTLCHLVPVADRKTIVLPAACDGAGVDVGLGVGVGVGLGVGDGVGLGVAVGVGVGEGVYTSGVTPSSSQYTIN